MFLLRREEEKDPSKQQTQLKLQVVQQDSTLMKILATNVWMDVQNVFTVKDSHDVLNALDKVLQSHL